MNCAPPSVGRWPSVLQFTCMDLGAAICSCMAQGQGCCHPFWEANGHACLSRYLTTDTALLACATDAPDEVVELAGRVQRAAAYIARVRAALKGQLTLQEVEALLGEVS